MAAGAFEVRAAENGHGRPPALLPAAVSEERDGIAAEPPIDAERGAASWPPDGTLVAHGAGEVLGCVQVEVTIFGLGEPAMMVAAAGAGSASGRRSPPPRSTGRATAARTS